MVGDGSGGSWPRQHSTSSKSHTSCSDLRSSADAGTRLAGNSCAGAPDRPPIRQWQRPERTGAASRDGPARHRPGRNAGRSPAAWPPGPGRCPHRPVDAPPPPPRPAATTRGPPRGKGRSVAKGSTSARAVATAGASLLAAAELPQPGRFRLGQHVIHHSVQVGQMPAGGQHCGQVFGWRIALLSQCIQNAQHSPLGEIGLAGGAATRSTSYAKP